MKSPQGHRRLGRRPHPRPGTATACGSDDGSDDGGSSSGGGKKITIGIKFDQPGLGQKTPQGYAGFDVDVATYVAKKLGYSEDQIEWKESKSADRETMLQRGDVDFIAATYSITPERQEKPSASPARSCSPRPARAAPRRRRRLASFTVVAVLYIALKLRADELRELAGAAAAAGQEVDRGGAPGQRQPAERRSGCRTRHLTPGQLV
ncbi:hypothetical protein SFUMM280S_03209 [Streptomyces fumanus]